MTSRSRVLLEKLIVTQLIKKFPPYGNRKLITVVSPSPKPQAGGPPLQLPSKSGGRPLFPQPEDALRHEDREPQKVPYKFHIFITLWVHRKKYQENYTWRGASLHSVAHSSRYPFLLFYYLIQTHKNLTLMARNTESRRNGNRYRNSKQKSRKLAISPFGMGTDDSNSPPLWDPVSLLSKGYRGKAAGAWSWPLTSTWCWD